MKGSETKLVSYMQGSDKRFVIPVYQRNYDWKTENCKQLYDDLIKVIRRGRKSHFFGIPAWEYSCFLQAVFPLFLLYLQKHVPSFCVAH